MDSGTCESGAKKKGLSSACKFGLCLEAQVAGMVMEGDDHRREWENHR